MAEDVVIDASVAIRVLVEDQAGHQEAVETLGLALERGHRLVAPALYQYEVVNFISRTQGKADRRAAALDAAHAIVDVTHLAPPTFQRALALAAESKLTFYDATYVALAEERGAILWTEDKEILKRAPVRVTSTTDLRRKLAKG